MIMNGFLAIACATESSAPVRRMRGGDLVIGAGFAARNAARELVDALVEQRDALPVERDLGEVGVAAAQRAGDGLRSGRNHRRRAHVARFGKEAEQAAAGVQLARLGQLHGDDPGIAPDDAATPYTGVEDRVTAPRHNATPPQGEDHNTVMNQRIWNLGVRLRDGGGRGWSEATGLADGAVSANQAGRPRA